MWMFEARQCHAWEHTAQLLAMLFNTRFGGKNTLKAADFNPYAVKPKPVVVKVPMATLQDMWCGPQRN